MQRPAGLWPWVELSGRWLCRVLELSRHLSLPRTPSYHPPSTVEEAKAHRPRAPQLLRGEVEKCQVRGQDFLLRQGRVWSKERQRHPLRALRSAQAPVPLRPEVRPVQFSGRENQKSGRWRDVDPTRHQTPKSATALCLHPRSWAAHICVSGGSLFCATALSLAKNGLLFVRLFVCLFGGCIVA